MAGNGPILECIFFTFQGMYIWILNRALIAYSLLQGYGSGGYALRIEGLKKVSLWSIKYFYPVSAMM